MRIELVEFQNSKISVEIVGVVFRLLLNVILEEWKVIRVVARKLQVIRKNNFNISCSIYRSILFNISGIVSSVPSSVLITLSIFNSLLFFELLNKTKFSQD